MKIPMMCLPAGASDGSYMVGTVISSNGDCEGCPYLASSQARSIYSSDGQICMVARCCGPSAPGRARKFGRPLSARLILQDVPSLRYLTIESRKSDGSAPASIKCRKVSCGVRLLITLSASISSPFCNTTPRARPLTILMCSTLVLLRISTPRLRGEQQASHHLREPLQMVLISGEHRGIVPGKFRDFLQRPRAILPHEQMAAVGKGRKERGVLGVHAIAEAGQFQIAAHARL